MSEQFYFTFEPDWRTTPLAFWVHVPTSESATDYVPLAPVAVLHKGFPVLHINAADTDLRFSSLAQLDHFIEVMEAKPRPTSRKLSQKRASNVGPNGHWLSRLPAKLKVPKSRRNLSISYDWFVGNYGRWEIPGTVVPVFSSPSKHWTSGRFGAEAVGHRSEFSSAASTSTPP